MRYVSQLSLLVLEMDTCHRGCDVWGATVILSERELCSLAQLGTDSLTLVCFRAELQCPAMDDDSLDEFEDQSPGPDVHPQLSAAVLSRDAGEPSPSSPPPPPEPCAPAVAAPRRGSRVATCSLQAVGS